LTKILLIEDSDEHADIVTRVLTAKKGWTVTRALSAKEGMLHAALKPFDIAIVDYRLPDGDGIDLLDSLRQQKPGMPILFLTAHGSEEVAMQAMSRGAADYLVKSPHYQKELPQRVADVLARSEDLARVAAAVRHGAQAAPVQPAMPRPAQGTPATLDTKGLARLVKTLVAQETVGAAVFDAEGKPLAAKLPSGVDADAFGTAVAASLSQAHMAVRQLPASAPPRLQLLEFDGGVLACATVPGPLVVALLLGPQADRDTAAKRARDAAQQVWEHSRA
jgi:DNA-binding response OmpR family regulator